jgi:hypothetical protein
MNRRFLGVVLVETELASLIRKVAVPVDRGDVGDVVVGRDPEVNAIV